jgi:two-component system nitrate/nitrite response regulator NarL
MAMSHSNTIRILMVDDHRLFLAGLRSLIEKESGLTIVGEAENRAQAIDLARKRPDIILLDLALGSENAFDFLPELLEVSGGAQILALTGSADPDLQIRAVQLGARGVLVKGESTDILFKAIRKVHEGEVWINRTMVASVVNELRRARSTRETDPEAQKIASLTVREREVVALIGEGRRNKQIAERLFISEKTVRHYLTSIFSKLEVSDRLELLIYAYQQGLAKIVPPSQPLADKPDRQR